MGWCRSNSESWLQAVAAMAQIGLADDGFAAFSQAQPMCRELADQLALGSETADPAYKPRISGGRTRRSMLSFVSLLEEEELREMAGR